MDETDVSIVNMLITLAIIAQGNSYSPYSHFPVGAAVLAKNDTGLVQVFTGANVENASYGLTVCAERAAIFSAVSAGFKKIIALVCVTKTGEETSCGACRQVEYEFNPDMEIYFCDAIGNIKHMFTPRQLLPDAFYFNKKE